MANSLNNAMLIGNLTRDPELRKTQSGQSVTTFSIATNRSFTNKAGEKKEEADYHNIVAWGKLAELCEQYLKKGCKVYVDGRMQTREWTDQAGIKRFRTEIISDNIIFLTSKGKPSTENNADMGGYGSGTYQPAPNAVTDDEIKLEDIPF